MSAYSQLQKHRVENVKCPQNYLMLFVKIGHFIRHTGAVISKDDGVAITVSVVSLRFEVNVPNVTLGCVYHASTLNILFHDALNKF